MVQIQILTIAVDAVDIEEMWLGCGDTVLHNVFIAPHEELDVVHMFKQSNLNGFRRAISNFSDKTGVLEFSVNCKFGNSEGEFTKEHRRILYRMTEDCGDMSTRGYEPGKSKEKRNFLY